jgi:transcription-repair coupling factor (superfamily II helicase)
VADLKAQASKTEQGSSIDDVDPEVNLQLSAYIPERYIPDISQRYITYKRMAALTNAPAAMQLDLEDELVDRYGPLPVETVTLFRIIRLKKDLAALRISKLEQGRDSLVLTFQGDTPLTSDMLLRYLQKNSGKKHKVAPKLTPDSRLVVSGRLSSMEHIFDTIATTLNELTALVQTTV